MGRAAWLLWMVAVPGLLPATTCYSPPPCHHLVPGAMFFVGEVLEQIGNSDLQDSWGSPLLRFRVRVREPLYGTPPDLHEVVLLISEEWRRSIGGKLYLFDLLRQPTGDEYRLGTCGKSGPADAPYTQPMLSVLRRHRNHPNANAAASVTVSVSTENGNHSVDGAAVTIEGPVRRTALADYRGEARFENLPAGVYRAAATHRHYTAADPAGSARERRTVSVEPHGFAEARVALAPALTVAGATATAEGKAWPNVKLQLWPATLAGSAYGTVSDEEGRFRFERVRPGRYYLATAGPEPASYYPGRTNRAEATVIQLDGVKEGLQLPIPAAGAKRTIRFKVLGLTGEPRAGIDVADYPFDSKGHFQDGYASIGRHKTDAAGTVTVVIFENAKYRVRVNNGWAADGDRVVPFFDIPPGSGDLDFRFQLRRP